MTIEFRIAATLVHINVRKEGPEDDKVTALDLKFQADVKAQLVDDLLCVNEEKGRALDAFWDSEGAPRMLSLGDVRMSRQILNAQAEVEDIHLRSCKAKSFSFSVRDKQQAVLTFSVSSTDFPSNTIAILAEKLQNACDVRFWTSQGDLFDQSSPQAAADRLQAMAQEDGAVATLKAGTGEVLATFGDEPDPLYEEAVAFVRETRRASISFLQRKLMIGYNRAARLIEALEAAGIVSSMEATGARRVLVQPLGEVTP